jgi:hypothetical protein
MSQIFTESDAWHGGDFELALELGQRCDRRLQEATAALWSHPSLTGCYLESDKEPAEQERVEAGSMAPGSACLGVATTPSGHQVACRSVAIRYDDGTDWLYLCLPLGSLGNAYPVGAYPFDDGRSHSWVLEVSDWFREIAKLVFASMRFRGGVVGFETEFAFGDVPQDASPSEWLKEAGVGDQRWFGYLLPDDQGLQWFPPTEPDAPMTLGPASIDD